MFDADVSTQLVATPAPLVAPVGEGTAPPGEVDRTRVPNAERHRRDSLMRGRVTLWQPIRGYRFAADAPLLAQFVADVHTAHGPFRVLADRCDPPVVLDVGAGCGVVGLLLLWREVAARVVAVEQDGELAALAAVNGRDNGFTPGEYEVVRGAFPGPRTPPGVSVWNPLAPDSRSGGGRTPLGATRGEPRKMSEFFDYIVCNPPFRSPEAGSAPVDAQRAAAHVQQWLDLPHLFRYGRDLLAPEGALCVILPTDTEDEAVADAEAAGLKLRAWRRIRKHAAAPAHRSLLAFVDTLADDVEGPLPDISLYLPGERDGANYLEAARLAFDGPEFMWRGGGRNREGVPGTDGAFISPALRPATTQGAVAALPKPWPVGDPWG